MKDQDHYAVLRVAPNADQATIKAAYRTRIRKCHPDLNPDLPDATRLSASLNLAYDVLCNEVKRGVYDWDRRQVNSSSAGNAASSSRRPGYQRREPGEQSSEANTTRDTRSSSRQRSGYQRQQRGGRDSGANTAGSATSDSRQRSGHQTVGTRRTELTGEQNCRRLVEFPPALELSPAAAYWAELPFLHGRKQFQQFRRTLERTATAIERSALADQQRWKRSLFPRAGSRQHTGYFSCLRHIP